MSTKKLQIIGNLGTKVYTQNDEPIDAPDGALWIDLDDESIGSLVEGAVLYTPQTLTPEQQAQARENIGANSQNASPWKGKIINFMGDSITEGYGSTVKYTDIIADALSATCNNYGIGGSTVADGQNPMYSRVLQMEEGAHLCVVFGGTNDFANYDRVLGNQFVVSDGKRTLNLDTSTFYGGLNQLCTNLYSRFPYSTLVLCTPINRQKFSSQETDLQANGNGLYLDEYVEAIKKVAAYFSIPCLDLYATANLHPYDAANIAKYYSASDQLHPNAEGHKHLANVMLRFFDTLAVKNQQTMLRYSVSDMSRVLEVKQGGYYSLKGNWVNDTSIVSWKIPCKGTDEFTQYSTSKYDMYKTYWTENGYFCESATPADGSPTTFTVPKRADIAYMWTAIRTEDIDDGSYELIRTLTDEVINAIEYSPFDMSSVLQERAGYYNLDGSFQKTTSFYKSWKIACKAGDVFYQQSESGAATYKTYWDADGNLIDSYIPEEGKVSVFTVPDNENIAYMWATVEQRDLDDGSFKLIRQVAE